jgi:archaemetzincin
MARIFTLPDDKDRQHAMGAFGGTPFLHRKAVTSFGALISLKKGPGPDDYLAHCYEAGQTFEQYRLLPGRVDGDRNTVVLQPLGEEISGEMLDILVGVSTAFFPKLTFTVKDALPMAALGLNAEPIYDSSAVVNSLRQPPSLSRYALIALTSEDLYHTEPSNFVFALNNAVAKIGVISTNRLQRAGGDSQLVYLRMAKMMIGAVCLAAGLKRCIYYECVMNGVWSVEELDNLPLHFCPICLRKLLFCFDFDPMEWYAGLLACFQRLPAPFLPEAEWLRARISIFQASLAK